jgi:hypothetical protein
MTVRQNMKKSPQTPKQKQSPFLQRFNLADFLCGDFFGLVFFSRTNFLKGVIHVNFEN